MITGYFKFFRTLPLTDGLLFVVFGLISLAAGIILFVGAPPKIFWF